MTLMTFTFVIKERKRDIICRLTRFEELVEAKHNSTFAMTTERSTIVTLVLSFTKIISNRRIPCHGLVCMASYRVGKISRRKEKCQSIIILIFFIF